MNQAMEEEGTTQIIGGLNSCLWCLSSYAADPVAVSRGREDNSGKGQSYKKTRYKLLLEYLLQKDTVHFSSEQQNEDQQRRHILIQKLLEASEMEEAPGESGTLYQLCSTCEGNADEVMRLHLALEVVQMKLVDKLSCLTDAIITNSMYGSNEDTKKRMKDLEIWLQQQQQENGIGTGGIMGETGRLKNYMDTLVQFQTLIFEGGRKPRSVPCIYLHKCMPISSFSEDQRAAYSTTVNSLSPSVLKLSASRKPTIKSTAPKTRAGSKASASSKRSISRKFPKSKSRKKNTNIESSIAACEQPCQNQAVAIHQVSHEASMDWNTIRMDGSAETEVKEEPNDDLPPSPLNPDGFQFQESFEQFSSAEMDPLDFLTTSEEVKVEDEEPEQQGLGKRRRVKPVRFYPPNYREPVYKPRRPPATEKPKLVKGAPRHLLKLFKPRRIETSKLTKKQKKYREKKRTSLPCASCDFVGENSYVFVRHLRGHETEEKVFECKETDCEERHFSGKQYFDFHTKLHKPSGGYKERCEICTMIVAPVALAAHMKSHEGTTVFPCSNCYYCTNNLKDYLNHMKHHIRLKTVPELACPLCSQLFVKQQRIQLTKHLYNDHGCNELLLKCQFKDCTQTFLLKAALSNHYNLHLKRFKCERCKEVFMSDTALRSHVQVVHLKLKLFMCNVGDCLENFKNGFQLENHQVQCHDFPKFKCDLCPLEFTNGTARRSHVKRSHNEALYVCETCGKGCTTMEALRKHEVVHFERNVSCDQCDFVTKSKYHLQRHKSTQHTTAPMKHGCPHCPKRFNFKAAMDDHIRTHTGERPYVCHMCSQAFAKKQPLDNHIKKIHASSNKTDEAETGTAAITSGKPTDMIIPVVITENLNSTDVAFSLSNNTSGSGPSTSSYVSL